MIPSLPRLLCRSFAVLLHAYPRDFRARHGREMRQVFADRCAEVARNRGAGALALWWFQAVGDVLIGAARERASSVSVPGALCLVIAVTLGMFAAILDFHTDEVTIAAAVLLGGTFAIGAVRPGGVWRWAVPAGLCLFGAYQFGPALGYEPRYPALPSKAATLLAVAPALIGAYLGAFARCAAESVLSSLRSR